MPAAPFRVFAFMAGYTGAGLRTILSYMGTAAVLDSSHTWDLSFIATPVGVPSEGGGSIDCAAPDKTKFALYSANKDTQRIIFLN